MLVLLASLAAGQAPDAEPPPATPAAPGEAFAQTLPGVARAIEMAPVPGGELVWTDEAGRERRATIAPFFLSRTEVPWEVFDAFVFEETEGEPAEGADALARPTTPYISVDRGFGHEGYPALSMSHRAARAFCAWMSARTGRAYRLPTDLEWQWACRAGGEDCADDARLAAQAWTREDARDTTHPVGSKEPNALGLHDLRGNVAEWVEDASGEAFVMGGSFLDRPRNACCDSRKRPSPLWNASDPQLPKSPWWLADASFVGLRLACDAPAEADLPAEGDGDGR